MIGLFSNIDGQNLRKFGPMLLCFRNQNLQNLIGIGFSVLGLLNYVRQHFHLGGELEQRVLLLVSRLLKSPYS